MSPLHVADVTPDLLARLGRELGNLDFTDRNQTAFLTCDKSCDIQAAPGNGKTALLVAKLALLARTWTATQQGVCVISHTNVAREELEQRLSAHPGGAVFLNYPHFVGTVTAFIHRFVALPYLRGRGWHLKWVDDNVFAARALSTANGDHRLRSWLASAKNRNEGIIRTLTLDRYSLNVRRVKYMPMREKPTGLALERLKERITKEGVYRFADMTALAFKAIETSPYLVNRIRGRFPLVLLDEAQDTDPEHLELLDLLFGTDVVFQRLGDQNQTLFERTELSSAARWSPADNVIPLDETRRFGVEIARFASRLTVRRAQNIKSKEGEPSHRVLILFDRESIGRVLHQYAREVQLYWGSEAGARREVWAVASRHSTHGNEKKGAWPRSLIDYHPRYRPEAGKYEESRGLCAVMRKAAVAFKECRPTSMVIDYVVAGLVDLLELQAYKAPGGRRVTCGNLWRCLGASDPKLPLVIRHHIYESVLHGDAPWAAKAWEQFCDDLKTAFGSTVRQADPEGRVAAFLNYDEKGGLGQDHAGKRGPENSVEHQGITIRLGSIHGVKGRTVDAIIVLESQVYKGKKVMDLEVVLPHAFAVCDHDFQKNPAELTAATNVFVAITRPRQLLALALRKEAVSAPILKAAVSQGWVVRDLTITNRAAVKPICV
jgi:DNA helicase-2/ATP-dependent DNA helicase PcrA